MELCRTGLRRLLGHLDIVPASRPEAVEPELIDVRPDECYVLAETEGLFEPVAQPGDEITPGAPVGRLHRRDGDPLIVAARSGGVVMARRSLARSAAGDWLYIIGRPVTDF